MSRRTLARGVALYAVAGMLTAVVAFVASIPFTDLPTIAAMTANSAVLVGWPTLLAADAVTRRHGGAG